MPNNKRKTAKTIKGKDSVHPSSRKAGQLDRIQLRAVKLQRAATKRKGETKSKYARPIYFQATLQSPLPITLPSLRALITDFYLKRHDDEIAQLTAARRPGRPKETKLVEMEEARRREWAEWESGFEVLDLTHPGTARLLWRWLEDDVAIHSSNIHLLRMIRISASQPDEVTLVRPGKTHTMGIDVAERMKGEEEVPDPIDWTSGSKEVEMEA